MHIPLLGITPDRFAFCIFCKFGTCKCRIEVPVSIMEITTCGHQESITAKDASVEGNTLIDMAVKRVLTTVNHCCPVKVPDDYYKV